MFFSVEVEFAPGFPQIICKWPSMIGGGNLTKNIQLILTPHSKVSSF